MGEEKVERWETSLIAVVLRRLQCFVTDEKVEVIDATCIMAEGGRCIRQNAFVQKSGNGDLF